MLSRGEEYRELGSDYFDRQNKPKVVNRLVQRLTRLGRIRSGFAPAEPS